MSAGGPTLRLAYLYPDLMNLYADRGNVTCLQQRCAWRGIELRVTTVAWGDGLTEPQDIYVIGGGQDRQQRAASEGLTRRHAERIGRDIADGASLLAVCGGYQLMGRSYRDADGTVMAGLGIFDMETVHPGSGVARCIGNIACRWRGKYLIGFENHGGRTYLGTGASPLAEVVRGFGNNGEDGGEGAVTGNRRRHVFAWRVVAQEPAPGGPSADGGAAPCGAGVHARATRRHRRVAGPSRRVADRGCVGIELGPRCHGVRLDHRGLNDPRHQPGLIQLHGMAGACDHPQASIGDAGRDLPAQLDGERPVTGAPQDHQRPAHIFESVAKVINRWLNVATAQAFQEARRLGLAK